MTLTVEAPDRSLVQRQQALQKANEIRFWRAALKEHMTVETARVLIARPPGRAETWKLMDLLRAVPKMGPKKVNHVMLSCRVAPAKTLGGLSERQRVEVSAALERWA